MSGRPALESWAKAYLKNFAGPLSMDVRIVAQLARDGRLLLGEPSNVTLEP